MVIQDGYSNMATRHNGILDKRYSQPNAGLGIACHSIEGSVSAALARFNSLDKDADGNYTPSAAASVMWINPKEGRLIQCYPVTASTWTSGNAKANCSLWAVESEGKAGEPLNENQVRNMLTLRDEFEAYTGRRLTRGEPDGTGRTLWQHNEVWNWATPNAGPTACPSGRYQPYFEALEDDMTEEQVLALAASQFLPLLAQALGAEKSTFSDTERVENIRSFIQAWIQKNDHTHPSENAQAGTRVPPHKHALAIAVSETGPVQGG